MEDIGASSAGEIVALFGIDCASGDTFTDESVQISMTSMHVPDAVISVAIKPLDNKNLGQMGKALGRFVREDQSRLVDQGPREGRS